MFFKVGIRTRVFYSWGFECLIFFAKDLIPPLQHTNNAHLVDCAQQKPWRDLNQGLLFLGWIRNPF
jgi:hypothetical protein